MKTRFKEGETIHYMDDNKPKSGVVSGITIRQGKGEGLHDKFDVPNGEIEITYHIAGNWYGVKDTNAFPSLESLRDTIFSTVAVAAASK